MERTHWSDLIQAQSKPTAMSAVLPVAICSVAELQEMHEMKDNYCISLLSVQNSLLLLEAKSSNTFALSEWNDSYV